MLWQLVEILGTGLMIQKNLTQIGFLIDFDHYQGKDLKYIPFGAGRRMCPGISFGMVSVELILAQLLFHFDLKLPDGLRSEELDMTELFALSVRRKNDLCLTPVPYCYALLFMQE